MSHGEQTKVLCFNSVNWPQTQTFLGVCPAFRAVLSTTLRDEFLTSAVRTQQSTTQQPGWEGRRGEGGTRGV